MHITMKCFAASHTRVFARVNVWGEHIVSIVVILGLVVYLIFLLRFIS